VPLAAPIFPRNRVSVAEFAKRALEFEDWINALWIALYCERRAETSRVILVDNEMLSILLQLSPNLVVEQLS
jgi:hypothetical protein